MNKVKKIIEYIFVLLCLLIIFLNFSTTDVKSKDTNVTWNGYSFVIWSLKCWDLGNHIDWKYSCSRYYDNVIDATNIWNNTTRSVSVGRLKSPFRKDTSSTVCDITIKDYSKRDGKNGYASINIFSYGTIKLNNYYLSDLSETKVTAVIIHELGHVMGISDNDYEDSIMYRYTPIVDTPQARDRASLEYVLRRYTSIFG